jgi:hypothetical protein
MPLRTIESDGARWAVGTTGRRTQYAKDEFTVCFTREGSDEQRVARYSPQGTKARENSLAELTETQLLDLLRRSQPSWTAVELGYRP